MYFGERGSSTLYVAVGTLAALLALDGVSAIMNIPRLTEWLKISLTPDVAGTALLHAIITGALLALLAGLLIGYVRKSPAAQKGKRLTPRVPWLEGEKNSNANSQRLILWLFFGIPTVANVFFWVQIVKARIYYLNQPLSTNPWADRIKAITVNPNCTWLHGCLDFAGLDGVDYYPILSDLAPLITWSIAIGLIWFWQRSLIKERQ
jgi:hypothetical protein